MDPTRQSVTTGDHWAFSTMVWPHVIESAYRQEQLADAARHVGAVRRSTRHPATGTVPAWSRLAGRLRALRPPSVAAPVSVAGARMDPCSACCAPPPVSSGAPARSRS